MAHDHPSFWLDLLGRIGAPIFAGTLVACLLASRAEPLHFVLMSIGLVMIVAHHLAIHHARRSGAD